MVKGVEELTAELERLGLRQLNVLVKGEVPVIEARPVEELPVGGPELAQGLPGEQRSVEIGVGVRYRVIQSWVGNLECTRGKVRFIDALAGRASEARAQERPVIVLADPYGEPSRKGSDAGDDPAAG